MATLTPDPEGGLRYPREVMTLIKARNNAGKHWPVRLKHNNLDQLIPETGIPLHVNGGPVLINGIDVTKHVQKGVENVFQHNAWSGKLKNITKK